MLDQRGAGEGVIADAVSAHPRIEQREGDEEEKKEPALRFASPTRRRRTESVSVHERDTRPAILTGIWGSRKRKGERTRPAVPTFWGVLQGRTVLASLQMPHIPLIDGG